MRNVPVMRSDAAIADQAVLTYGRVPALARSSFRIPSGAVTTLIGPNGSGKSTVLNAIAGLLQPITGRIEVLGKTPTEARRRVAYVLQTTKVNEALPVTVREVVGMGRYSSSGSLQLLDAADREVVEVALKELDLIPLASRHLRELSGGERQRVFVAQGMAQDREILLLDEPLTGLDLMSGTAISAAVEAERRAGRTVVMSTHSLVDAAASDHVILLSNRVVAEGQPTDVLTLELLQEAYGEGVVEMADGGVFVDDAAHQPVPGRHVHQERTIHVEAPGADLHGPDA